MTRPGVDRIAGAVLVLAGLGVGLEATTFDVAFLTDPVGPKALPLVVALMLVAGGVHTVLRARESVALPDGPALARMAGALLAFLIYAVALPWLGFLLSTTLVVAALGTLFGGPWKGALATGAALSAALWLLFATVLALPLPLGDLWIR